MYPESSQPILEYVVIFGVLAIVVGAIFVMFWKQIVVGCMAVLCIAVMANHKTPEVKAEPKPEPKIEQKKKEPDPDAEERTQFMEDCLTYTNNTPGQCRNIWYKRETDDGNSES
jgi:hypothetical protein